MDWLYQHGIRKNMMNKKNIITIALFFNTGCVPPNCDSDTQGAVLHCGILCEDVCMSTHESSDITDQCIDECLARQCSDAINKNVEKSYNTFSGAPSSFGMRGTLSGTEVFDAGVADSGDFFDASPTMQEDAGSSDVGAHDAGLLDSSVPTGKACYVACLEGEIYPQCGGQPLCCEESCS